MRKKIFGLDLLSGKVPELLKKNVKYKNEPSKWNWLPFNADKIENIQLIVAEEKKEVAYASISNINNFQNKKNIVLIFAMGNLSYGLLKNLDNNNIKYIYIDFPQFILKGKINIYTNNDKIIKVLRIENIEIDLDNIKIILWNPPKYPRPFIDFCKIGKDERSEFLFRKRWAQVLKDFKYLVPSNAIWIPSDPLNGSQNWQNKIGEYNIATEIGFKIPAFIHSNDKKKILEFCKKYKNNVVLREFSTPPFSFPPIKLNNETINEDFFENIETSPCTIQAYIEKEYELRVVVLFNKIFACKIDSQNSILAKDDWRVYDDANVKWEIITLPENINEMLINFNKTIGINWSSIDLIYSTDGNYYFLEANRPGAHYWLDAFVGLDITEEITIEIKKLLK